MLNKLCTPWSKYMGNVPLNITYSESTMYDAVFNVASSHPNLLACSFFGRKINYKGLISRIDKCASGLKAMGVKENDHVIVALPNCPQALITIYAVNKCGAILNMIHPLSAPNEIDFYIKNTNAKTVIILDQFYLKFSEVCKANNIKNFIVTSIADEVSPIAKSIMKFRGIVLKEKQTTFFNCTFWGDIFRYGKDQNFPHKDKDDVAVILYSGGTTGTNKGIMLTNYNLNVLAKQIVFANPFVIGDSMLSVMPLFHGFGLGVGVHAMLISGGNCILIPQFNPEQFARLIEKEKANFIAGVPSMFDSMTKQKFIKKIKLNSLKGVFSGGDSLVPELQHRFNDFLKEHGANVEVREGYGTTECVNAASINPMTLIKEKSIGIPLPDNIFRIVKPGTLDPVPYGEIGEITISGPTVMKGYLNNQEETDLVIKYDDDNRKWLLTGDLAFMDEDGFIFFKGRNKRMIITMGYNVYPNQVEAELNTCEYIKQSCVIGIPDQNLGEKIKAFIVLKDGVKLTPDIKKTIRHYLRDRVAKYAIPQDYEFRDTLPKTKVGKIAYRELEEEEKQKIESKKND